MLGEPPYRQLERSGGENRILLRNVAGAEFTGYDEKDRFIFSGASPEKLKKIRKLRVVLRTHEAEENPGKYINDKINWIDLDGDPSNGVAKVTEVKFVVEMAP